MDDDPFRETLLGQLSHIDVLGQTDEQAVLLFDRERRALVRVRSLEGLRVATAVQLFGPAVLEVAGDREGMARLRLEIAEAAYTHRICEADVLAQGCHWLAGEWLVVNGTRAACASEGVVEGVHWRGRVLGLEAGAEWLPVEMGELGVGVGRTTPAETFEWLADYFQGWHFARESDRLLLPAMVLASPLQTGLPYRPSVYITGRSGSGKSTLLLGVARVLGPLAQVLFGQITEAGLRQSLQERSGYVLLDEFEHGPTRRLIVEMLRNAWLGGHIVRGTAAGASRRFHVKHIVWTAAIDVALTRAADARRFLIVELERPEFARGTPGLPHPDAQCVADVHLAALRLGPQVFDLCNSWRPTAESAAGALGRYTRLVPAAVLAACHEASPTTASVDQWIDRLGGQQLPEMIDDEESILAALLAGSLPGHRGRLTVGRALHQPTEYRDALEVAGFKVVRERVFIQPEVAARALLEGSQWRLTDLRTILARLPGARRDQQRLGRARPMGVSLPLAQVVAPE